MGQKIVILDAGHGGLINGQYVTPGKRSPKWNIDPIQLDAFGWPYGQTYYEGVGNRMIVSRIAEKLSDRDILHTVINNSQNEDVSLSARVALINEICKTFGPSNCLGVSVHSDAHQVAYADEACTIPYNAKLHKGIKPFYKKVLEATTAKGFSVWTTPGDTQSDKYAEYLLQEAKLLIPDWTFRTDYNSDGDGDMESKFQILTETHCPFILSENGFHTNREDCVGRLMTKDGRELIAEYHANMIEKYWKI